MTQCEVLIFEHLKYQTGWDLQNQLVAERQAGGIDRLLLVEHLPTYTLGTSGHMSNLLLSEEEYTKRGIDVVQVDRGGDITYHGPGQVVGYPIIQLSREHFRTNVVGYVRDIEEVIILTLADYGIKGKRISGLTGVWVDTARGEEKICAIGVRVNVKAITKHGFALNVNTDLSYFEGIIPCGIEDKGVTSLSALLGHDIDLDEVRSQITFYFGEVFGYEMIHHVPN